MFKKGGEKASRVKPHHLILCFWDRDQSLKTRGILFLIAESSCSKKLAEQNTEGLVERFSKGRHFSILLISWQASPNLNLHSHTLSCFFYSLSPSLVRFKVPGIDLGAVGAWIAHQGQHQDRYKILNNSFMGTLRKSKQNWQSEMPPCSYS